MADSTLTNYQVALEATLGAIAAHTLVQSRSSSKTIRDCSKHLDNLSTQLRKELLAADKLMGISNDPAN